MSLDQTFIANLALVISNLVIAGLMLLIGFIFSKHPPKDINGVYGYRSKRSMLNQETWDFAHQFSGKLCLKWGVWLVLLTILCTIFSYIWLSDSTWFMWVNIGMSVIICLSFCLVLVPTEKALKANFDEKGNRRSKDMGSVE